MSVVTVALCVPLATPGGAAPLQTVGGHVPAAAARLTALNRLPATNSLHLAIGLPLRNQAMLSRLLQQIYNPASANYHHFLTRSQFTDQFGPTAQDYQQVIDFAQANGLTVSATHPSRMVLDVRGSVENIEKVFHLKLQVYQHPTEARTFYAPDAEPSLDLSVPILHIDGLSSFHLPRPLSQKMPLRSPSDRTPSGVDGISNALSYTGSGPQGTFMGNDFRAAYAPDVALTGSGQTVALFELDGYFASDISTYEQMARLPKVPLLNFLVDGFSGVPGLNNVEVALDIEMVACMAPNISQIVVYEGLNDGETAIITDMLLQIAADGFANQISSSWLLEDNPTWDNIYQMYGALGMSFLQASGDNDAFVWNVLGQQRTDDTNITLVGGTTLTTTGPGGPYASETVWNWDVEYGPALDGEGSGGGISPSFTLPYWQHGVANTNNLGSSTNRNIPDLALTADNIFVVADDGQLEMVGGTSAAAPLWAAFIALVNQQAAINGVASMGFLNPAIYAIGNGSNYTVDFHDIKTGNNFWSLSTNLFPATAGYDLCTGWGSPAGQQLIYDLAGLPPRHGFLQISVNPPSGSALLRSNAQPIYVSVTDVYAVTNASVTGTIPGVTNLAFLDNGQPPDGRGNDGIYSALFQVPAATNTIAMTLTANATNEFGVTNVIYYTIVAPPPNDDFSNATKVPVGGATYIANNKFATLEPGEPSHDGDAHDGESLWWDWTPGGNTNVYINTLGSAIDNVLAVYTGNKLVKLVPVAATNSDLALDRPAYVQFNALANTAYYIAVASSNSTNTGSLTLQIAPGGQPDLTPPVVTVSTPLSGLTVTNSPIVFTGTAYDPEPNATGVSEVLITTRGITTVAIGTTNWSSYAFVVPGLNTIQVTAVDAAGNVSAPVTVQLYFYVQNPVNDFFVDSLPLVSGVSPAFVSGISGQDTVSNTNATKEPAEPDHAGNIGGKSVWWYFEPTNNGVLSLDTSGSTFDTLLGLYTGSVVSNLTTIADNDDAFPGAPGGFSRIDQAVRSNVLYHIAVDGYNGASGVVVLNYSFTPATLYVLTASNTVGGVVQAATTNAYGGAMILPASAGDVAANSTVQLTAYPNPFYQFDIWNGSWFSLNNPVSFVMINNMTVTGYFVPIPFTDNFQSGNLQTLSWTTGGYAPWFVQTNVVETGRYAARSGVITNSQNSWLALTATFRAGTGSFDYLVSSETNYDVLDFTVDGILVQQWSGQVGWATFAFPLTAGTHSLEWNYLKDPTISKGLDAAFLENVNLPISVPTNSTSAALLQVERQSDGSPFIILSGQTNQQYILQTSTNLYLWSNSSTQVLSRGFLRIPISINPTNPAEFYRAVTSP